MRCCVRAGRRPGGADASGVHATGTGERQWKMSRLTRDVIDGRRPTPFRQLMSSTAEAVNTCRTRLPAKRPAVTVPVKVTVNVDPEIVAVRLAVNVVVWPVFQVMVKFAVPASNTIVQSSPMVNVRLSRPAVTCGAVAEMHGLYLVFRVTRVGWLTNVNGGVNVTTFVLGGSQRISRTSGAGAGAGAGTGTGAADAGAMSNMPPTRVRAATAVTRTILIIMTPVGVMERMASTTANDGTARGGYRQCVQYGPGHWLMSQPQPTNSDLRKTFTKTGLASAVTWAYTRSPQNPIAISEG